MRKLRQTRSVYVLGIFLISAALGAAWAGGHVQGTQTIGPHEQDPALAPPPIIWSTPSLPEHPLDIESAEERHLRIVPLTSHLEQPWSLVFVGDNEILVTERPGRIRVVRNGVLDPIPVAGVPSVSTGGLQGLMDIVIHPRFDENHWVYFVYHKPLGNAGATTLARGVWNGTRLVDVHDVFESRTTGTEASRIA